MEENTFDKLFEEMKAKNLVSESADWIVKAIEQRKLNDLNLANSCLLKPYDRIDLMLLKHTSRN